MGHHIDTDGNFQSDHHKWLPPNTMLFSQHDRAFLGALEAAGQKLTTQLPGKVLVSFSDPFGRIVLAHYSRLAPDLDLTDDIKTVMKSKFGWTDEELAKK